MIDIAPELNLRLLQGDPKCLGQILSNMIGNAIKFTSTGSVWVRATQEAERMTDVLVRFEVQDTGIGISSEDQKRVFDAFVQKDSGMNRSYGSTGLGLAICKHLVSLMGGEIGVYSSPVVGSTFWFTVPLLKAGPVDRSALAGSA